MTPASDPTAVVRAVGVVKRWGSTTALDGATLEVHRGVTGLLGANGAGKTTLLGMLLG
ncbi:MAG: transporter, partial [Acidimicrobiales bacterium]|nr:transporter [Acidimicrobiales bacterium]